MLRSPTSPPPWSTIHCATTSLFLPLIHVSSLKRHLLLDLQTKQISSQNLLLPQLFCTALTSQQTPVYGTGTLWPLPFLAQTNSSRAMYTIQCAHSNIWLSLSNKGVYKTTIVTTFHNWNLLVKLPGLLSQPFLNQDGTNFIYQITTPFGTTLHCTSETTFPSGKPLLLFYYASVRGCSRVAQVTWYG